MIEFCKGCNDAIEIDDDTSPYYDEWWEDDFGRWIFCAACWVGKYAAWYAQEYSLRVKRIDWNTKRTTQKSGKMRKRRR